jgi:hypothetical protein
VDGVATTMQGKGMPCGLHLAALQYMVLHWPGVGVESVIESSMLGTHCLTDAR